MNADSRVGGQSLRPAQDQGALAANLGDDTARSVDIYFRVSLVSAVVIRHLRDDLC